MTKSFHLLVSLCILGSIIFFCGCKKQSPQLAEEPSVAKTPTAAPSVSDGKIEMSLYYAGHPGSEREKDFADFLIKHFTKIETGDLAAFDGSQSNGFDVTILDYDGDGFESPRPNIPHTFTKPVVTMGVTGAFISGQRNLKTNYL
ncbi:MAG: hypothetical protein ACYSUT_12360 [Planctomycetota bacterium]|jgi:hypothetical protein